MQARIYQPSKSAMTSGQGNSRTWTLEYAPEEAKRIDPLMGWTGSGDMRGQANIRARGYGGNFAYDRRGAWTH